MRKICGILLVFVVLLSLGSRISSEKLPSLSSEHLPYGAPGLADHVAIREGYVVGLSCQHKIAVWVSYRLKKERLAAKVAARTDRFREDREFPCCSVKPGDYKGSGYDRGHLASAGDMTFSVKAMEDSFLMSNIAPQKPGFNRGIWKKLETQVRQWALAEEDIIVVTGAVFPKEVTLTVGPSKITVPEGYFKVVYDLTPPEKMIAFVISNESSRQDLQDFAVTVNAVEKITGLDFFPELPQVIQQKLEAEIDILQWQWK